MKNYFLFACVLVFFCLGKNFLIGETFSKTDQPFTGPVLGHTTHESIAIWFYTLPGRKVKLHYSEKNQEITAAATFTEMGKITANEYTGKGQAYMVTVTKLKTDTVYDYRITIDGKSSITLIGQFKTAPAQGQSKKFKIAISSCVAKNFHKAWDVLRENEPDFHLMLGDTAYVDRTDPKRHWDRHLRVRNTQEIARAFKNIPHYSVWDDHDYGANNGDSRLKGKEKSLATWKQLWCNPEMGLKDIPGVFYKFSWADVDFFVLDGRYYRSSPHAPNDDKKTMLGDTQFNWLVKSLKESKAKFKVLATGSTWISKDSWKPFPESRRRLLKAIQENKISGVVYFSGDLHYCKIKQHGKLIHPIGYPLVEITSSGIGNTKNKDGLRSFIIIEFDTTLNDPVMTATILGMLPSGKKYEGTEQSWKLSQLSIK